MKEYFRDYAESLGANLNSVKSISKFTNNSSVIGQYVEKVVINFLQDMVVPINISTGTIIYPNADIKDSPQLDIILWDANPLPPIYRIDDFGVIPRNSVVGILEIKRTDYDYGLDHIEKIFKNQSNYLPEYMQANTDIKPGFLGVVCILEKYKKDGSNKYTRLRDDLNNSVIHLINSENGNLEINHDGIFEFINFVAGIMNNHNKVEKQFYIDPN